MKAITFEYSLPHLAYSRIAGMFTRRAYVDSLSCLKLKEIPDPSLPADDWTVVRTGLCGICGSDTKQVFLDADLDNPLTALISFPQVLGHEVVGTIERVGPGVTKRKVGERVVLNPWLSCAPRGIHPLCPACQQGLYFVCEHFQDGILPPGIHTGNCTAVTGGYAPLMPAHESQLFPIPDNVSFDQAVLCDPFSVSLHGIFKAPPPEGGLALIYGCGTLGMLAIAALKLLYPTVTIAAVARHEFQENIARQLGATHVIRTYNPVEVIEWIGKIVNAPLKKPWYGKPWLMGGVDVIYDTVGSPETMEVGLRITRPRGSILVTGVDHPARFEWTPHYFKEINLVGSNAFGIENFEGARLHAFEIYMELRSKGRLQLPQLITHRFRQEQYAEALLVSHNKEKNHAIKIVFEYNQ